MQKYVRKPLVVEAEQWFADFDKAFLFGGCPKWKCGVICSRKWDTAMKYKNYTGEMRNRYYLETNDGVIPIKEGDFVVIDYIGKKSVIDQHHFRKIYEAL